MIKHVQPDKCYLIKINKLYIIIQYHLNQNFHSYMQIHISTVACL